MDNKLQLKKMSHKKLRKLVKKLSIELKNTNQIKETALNSCSSLLVKQSELHKRIEDELACYNGQLEKKDNRIEELEYALDVLGHTPSGMPLDAAVDLGTKMLVKRIEEGYKFLGEMPNELVMGVDGQLKEEGHQPFDEPTNGVSEPAKVDEAVEWAKRNGHHFPNGKPDRDRMKEVNIPSAEEISQKNQKAFQEMSDRMKHS